VTQRVSVYSGFTAKLKSGPRRQFGPRRSPERFWCFHRVIGPIQLYGNTDFHLGRSWVKTGYVAHGHFCCIHRYTRTRVASRPSRAIQLYSAIQRYTALYIIQLYIAIHYTTSTTPLWRSTAASQSPIHKALALWVWPHQPRAACTVVVRPEVVNSRCLAPRIRFTVVERPASRTDGECSSLAQTHTS
jgi:hypothetical protein